VLDTLVVFPKADTEFYEKGTSFVEKSGICYRGNLRNRSFINQKSLNH